jgi:hypothetical protein
MRGSVLSISKWGVVAATGVSLAAFVSPASVAHTPSSADTGKIGQHTEVMRLTTKSTGVTMVDHGTPGPGIGDQIILTANLFRYGLRYGSEGAVCTRVAAQTTHCTGTFSLPLGQVTWQHLRTSPPGTPPSDFHVAVTGGTGAYATARGYAHIARISESGGSFTLHLVR